MNKRTLYLKLPKGLSQSATQELLDNLQDIDEAIEVTVEGGDKLVLELDERLSHQATLQLGNIIGYLTCNALFKSTPIEQKLTTPVIV